MFLKRDEISSSKYIENKIEKTKPDIQLHTLKNIT